MMPRCFVLRRHEDETGVSTAHGAAPGQDVAWGVEFPDGPCVIRWCISDVRQTAVFACLDDIKAVHDLCGEVDRLRAVVLKHGDHTPACNYRRREGDGRHCLPSCGWDAIGGEFAELDAEETDRG